MEYKVGDAIIFGSQKLYATIIEIKGPQGARDNPNIKVLFNKEKHPHLARDYPKGYRIKARDINRFQCRLKKKRRQKE